MAPEALFQKAWSSMLMKASNVDKDILEQMKQNYDLRFPQMPMRDDATAITEFAGMGGADLGFERAGIPVSASVDAMSAANRLREANFEGDVIEGYIGTDQGMLHPDDLVERYADAAQGRKLHYHASPPCQAFSRAMRRSGPSGMDEQELHENRLKAWPMIGNAFYTVEQLMKHPDVNLNSWSLEEAPGVVDFVNEHPELLDPYVSPPFKKIIMALLRDKPNAKMDAVDYGVPTTRGRMFIGQGWDKNPTHYKATKKPQAGRLPSPSILDFLPHLEQEEKDNFANKKAIIDELLSRGQLNQEAAKTLLNQSFVTQMGSAFPGRGSKGKTPAVWNDERRSTAFKHFKPVTETSTGITHNMLAHLYNRMLEPEEVAFAQGIDPTYNFEPARDMYYRYITPKGNKKSIPALKQTIGNVVVPPVMTAVANSAFGMSPQQSKLTDFNLRDGI